MEKRVLSVEIIDFRRTSFVGRRLVCGVFRGRAFSLLVDCVDSVAALVVEDSDLGSLEDEDGGAGGEEGIGWEEMGCEGRKAGLGNSDSTVWFRLVVVA